MSEPNPRPNILTARRILCIQPHYDDNDIGAGGTLARLHDQGTEIIYLTVTDDLVGVVDPDLTDDQAAAQLREEQHSAGALIGIDQHEWLGYPDAGDYNYYEMRRAIISAVRRFSPDALMTCDPWLPYEAHRDHVKTGLAVAEASFLHRMVRLKTDPQVDKNYEPYEIAMVVFYFSHAPNTIVDIDTTRDRKQRALSCYGSQFTSEDMQRLLDTVQAEERHCARQEAFTYGEALKILRPNQLHIDPHTWDA